METTRYEVHGVLAGAYNRGRSSNGGIQKGKEALSHAIAADADWTTAKTLCGKIKAERLCDLVEEGAPTCPVCAKRLARLAA